ncbi:MAG: phospho-N-acetylmuramoyl-pentapeptide-transferase [Rickettsiales bacterium]|jgi:phospho-N-acetylmuramoyl-pentapeptide-transferase|nr:phospho-N-acetylmuramoyl-pentapeptide-transferase [Rickettsiales bacterium]
MLTSFFLNHGYKFFASGWAQFGFAFAAAFLIMIAFGRPFINAMRRWQKKGQPIRSDGPQSHFAKVGTPTMGGILILAAIFISSILFIDMANPVAWIALLPLLMFGTVGFIDDFYKIKRKSSEDKDAIMKPAVRLGLGLVFTIILAYLINLTFPAYVPGYSLSLPFGIIWPLGLFYFVFAYFVITGSANAANITDGLDGMLSKIYLPVLIVLVIALYGATRIGFMDTMLFLPGAGGLYPVLGAVFGAVLGFLWWNSAPAAIFMGDVGSLALGGFMGTVAMLLKSEIIMGVAALMMVLILLSSLLQTTFFKLTRKLTGQGKRIFAIAPLHHLLEHYGWPESKVVERFFVASILFSGAALALLKFA